MGLRGPTKKSNVFKVIEGTSRPDRMVDPLAIDGELLQELPDSPEWMTAAYALAEWHRLGPVLARCKMLNEGNISAFAVMCQSLSDGILGDHKAMALYVRLVGDFGLTPASRGRVKATVAKDEKPKGFGKFAEQARA